MMYAVRADQWSAFWSMIVAVVAVLTLGGSLLAWWLRRKKPDPTETLAHSHVRLVDIEADRRSEEIAARAAEAEARRHGDVRLRFVTVDDYEVIAQLINVGQGEARDVRVEMVGAIGGGELPPQTHDRVIASIPPTMSERIRLTSIAMGDAPGFKCRVSWTDDAGQRETWQELHWD